MLSGNLVPFSMIGSGVVLLATRKAQTAEVVSTQSGLSQILSDPGNATLLGVKVPYLLIAGGALLFLIRKVG